MAATNRASRPRRDSLPTPIELLEDRRLLAAVMLDANTTYQTIQGWGTAAVYPTNLVTIAQAGAIMRDAGMNVVRVTPSANDYTYTVGGNMSTPVPISANLDDNVARFNPANSQADLVNWLKVNGLDPDRTKVIGSLWSPPHWMKITTGRLIDWGSGSGYDPVLPWGAYGANTGAGRVNPTMWTDWARYVLSTVKYWQQETGQPMYAFSFQNEPNVPTSYNSCTFDEIANDVNNPSAGYTSGHWDIYGDAVQALANELAAHPEITTKFFGPELSQLGGGSSLTACNPYNLGNYNAVRQNLISRGLLNVLSGWATHEYTNASGGDAALWDAWYNGSQHAANIVSNGTSNYLDWLGPTPGIAGDNKEIWQTETDGENQTWTKDGAMAFGLKIFNALVYGHVSGYTTWDLTGYNATDQWGVVQLNDINNPTNSYKYDAFKQFSRWIRPGAQRIGATFENGKASIGGANELDTYDGLNVAAFNQAQDKRLTMVFVNMQTSDQSTTITIPAGMNISSFQVYQTSGTQKYAQLANLIPSNGKITLTIPASSFVTITGSYAQQSLPAGWTSGDIGGPALAGSSNYDSGTGTFTLLGSGSDIWGSSDQFQFAHTVLNGNGRITARVTSVSNTNASAKAGVMYRDSTAANAAYAFVWVSPGDKVVFETRSTNGSYSNYSYTLTPGLSPVWVRLARSGANADQFSAYYSQDGVTWTQVGTSQSVTMATNALAGLAVTSHTNSALCTGTFDGVQTLQSVSVVAPATAAPNPATGNTTNLSVLGAGGSGESSLTYTWALTSGPAAVSFSANGSNAAKNTTVTFTQSGTYTFQVTIADAAGPSTTSVVTVPVTFGIFTSALDIGSPSPAGASNYDVGTDTYTVSASGSDIWNNADQFHFVSKTLSGDGTILARVTGVQNTNTWSKAGVMFRDSTAAGAMFADIVVTPSSGISFQWRNSTGGGCGYAATSGAAPAWVKLVRLGNSFSAYYATTTGMPTATDWIQVGTAQPIAMNTSALAGLAVTSHAAGNLCTCTFTNVQVLPPAPASVSFQVNDGSAQRSMISSLRLAFDQSVTLAADAVLLTRRGGAFTGGIVLTPSTDKTAYTVTFTGVGPSLADGTYIVTLKASSVTDSFGQTLTSGDRRFKLFRLFGDANGDRMVDNADLVLFRAAMGSTTSYFDYDNNGVVDALDYAQFRKRLVRRVL